MIALAQSNRFCYSFIPLFNQQLLNFPLPALEDFAGKCETIFEELKFAKHYFEHEKFKYSFTNADIVTEIWINLWCKTLPYHQIYEQHYRLNQLLDVLLQYKIEDEGKLIQLYTDMMKYCFTFGSARLAINLFDNIKSFNIRSASSVLSVYLAAISSNETSQPIHNVFNSFTEETKKVNTSLDYSIYFDSCQQVFSQRTFLTEEIEYIVSEEVKLAFGLNNCSHCNTIPTNLSLIDQKSLPVLCEKCESELTPILKVRVGRPIVFLKDKPTYWEQEFPILSFKELRAEIDKLDKESKQLKVINLDEVRRKKQVFWNIVWYFQVHKLPYDLFLPYKKVSKNALVTWKKKDRNKTGVRFNVAPENSWFHLFKQIRVLALCNHKLTQT